MIFTSYFAKIKDFPQNIVPISICGKAPAWYSGLQYKKLAPKYGFFQTWKQTHDNDYYIKCFYEQVLSLLTPEQVSKELNQLSSGKDIALICYEKPDDFCHRHIVAEWMNKDGFDVQEYSFDTPVQTKFI